MGLLKVTDNMNRGDDPDNLQNELLNARNELKRIRRHNDSLVSQVNNLLHFIQEQNLRKRDLQQRISINPKTGLANHNKMDQDFHSFFGTLMEQPEPVSGALILIKLDSNYDTITKTA